jgi:hypothetical protein
LFQGDKNLRLTPPERRRVAFDNPVWPTLILTFGPLPWFSFCSYSH